MNIDPYAPPKADLLEPTLAEEKAFAEGLWREGNLAVTDKNIQWPDRCVVCNRPSVGKKLRKRLFWHPPWVYVFILLHILIYAIVAAILRKNGYVHIGLCRAHKRRRLAGILIGWLGLVFFIGVIIAGADTRGDLGGIMAIGGIVGILGCAVAGIIMSRVVVAKRIDAENMWIKVGRPFLESLPDTWQR